MNTHIPRKRFSQNFLVDDNVIRKIINSIGIQASDTLVEIGPGLGALTKPLLQTAGKLQVIEIDRDAIAHLEEHVAPLGDLQIHSGNVLKFDLAQITPTPLRIIGNLPYHISTPILFHCLEYANIIKDMTFMLQNEVVDRMCAEPNSHDYGRLSVMIQYHCQANKLFMVSRNSFSPAPKVESAIVRLVPYTVKPFPVEDEVLFADIVRHAFNQRRKTLRNSLRGLIDVSVIDQIDIDWTRRPEQLALEEYAALCESVRKLR